MNLHTQITALRAMPKFGSIRGQLECDRDDWRSREQFNDGTLDYAGEGTEYADAFQALIDLVGNYPCHAAPDVHGPMEKLSPRERDVCKLLVDGAAFATAHTTLGISRHTVRNHLKKAFRKLGVRSQVELVAVLVGRKA